MPFDLEEAKNMLEENGFNLYGSANVNKDADDELEKEKFTEEEFEKACEDLGLEDSGEETNDVDDFFDRLVDVNNNYGKDINIIRLYYEGYGK